MPTPNDHQMQPVTLAEALNYNKDALVNDIEKRKKNIEIFRKAIDDEEIAIDRNRQMIALIEANKSK